MHADLYRVEQGRDGHRYSGKAEEAWKKRNRKEDPQMKREAQQIYADTRAEQGRKPQMRRRQGIFNRTNVRSKNLWKYLTDKKIKSVDKNIYV